MASTEKVDKWLDNNFACIEAASIVLNDRGFDTSDLTEVLIIFLEEGLAKVLETDPDHSDRPRKT